MYLPKNLYVARLLSLISDNNDNVTKLNEKIIKMINSVHTGMHVEKITFNRWHLFGINLAATIIDKTLSRCKSKVRRIYRNHILPWTHKKKVLVGVLHTFPYSI